MNKALKYSLRALLLASPTLAYAATLNTYFTNTIKPFLSLLVNILIAVAVFVLILGIFSYITAAGDEEKMKSARSYILYGVIGVALMILIRGFIDIAVNTISPGLVTTTPTAAGL
ncbi:MAG: hypothetical protein AAB372_01180 [Patescibacteria group bacterium]